MNQSQETEVLWNKYKNVSDAQPTSSYTVNQGYGTAAAQINASEQLWTQQIPATAPVDLDVPQIIPNGVYQQSDEYPYIRTYYLDLSAIKPGISYWYASTNGDFPNTTNLCRDAIPFNFDPVNLTYNITVYSGSDPIPPDSATTPWNFDGDAGILTFFPTGSLTTGPPEPISINFWRYVGLKGTGTVATTAATNASQLYYLTSVSSNISNTNQLLYTSNTLSYNPSSNIIYAASDLVNIKTTPSSGLYFIPLFSTGGSGNKLVYSSDMLYNINTTTLTLSNTLSLQNIDLSGISSRLRLYERESSPVVYYDMFVNATDYLQLECYSNIFCYWNPFGGMVLQGSSAGIYLYSTTSGGVGGDYYRLVTSGAAGNAQFVFQYYDALTLTAVNSMSLTADGLLWVGAGSQTGVGLKLSDRATANTYTMFPTGDTLYWQFNSSNRLQLSSGGYIRTLGPDSAFLNSDQTTGYFWNYYSTGNILNIRHSVQTTVSSLTLTAYGRCVLNGTDCTLVLNDRTTTSTWDIFSSGNILKIYSPVSAPAADVVQVYYNQTITGNDTLNPSNYISASLIVLGNTGSAAIRLVSSTLKIGIFYQQPAARMYAMCTVSGGTIGPYLSYNSSTNWVTNSDRRMKHDIQPLSPSLSKICKLNPVKFKWNENNKEEVGLIAQEVFEVLPEVVDAPENPEIKMGISYQELIPFLIKGMQEQQALIQTLTDRITLLESRV